MKIKSIEDFTLEECQERLLNNPTPLEREQLNQRIDALSKQAKAYQERLKHNVKWVDGAEFFSSESGNIYANVYTPGLYFSALFFISVSFFSIVPICYWLGYIISFSVPTYLDYDEWSSGIYNPHTPWGFMFYSKDVQVGELWCYNVYPMIGIHTLLLLLFLISLIIFIVLLKKYKRIGIDLIYNVENENAKKWLRIQDKTGYYGLIAITSQNKKVRLFSTQLLSVFNNIYVCGDDAYICVKGEKSGVYNTSLKKMVLPVAYDDIIIQSDGTLLTKKDGNQYYFTTKGYRVVK